MTPTERTRPPGSLDDASVRLEGKLEPLVEVLPLYETLERALKRRAWKDALYTHWTALGRATQLDSEVQIGISAVERRAELEGWPGDAETVRLARKLKSLRASLQTLATRRSAGGLELGLQLRHWHTELAEQAGAGRFDAEIALPNYAIFGFVAQFVFWLPSTFCAFLVLSSPVGSGQWWFMLGLLACLAALTVFFKRLTSKKVRTYLRVSRAERAVEVWSGDDQYPRRTEKVLKLAAESAWRLDRKFDGDPESGYSAALSVLTDRGFEELVRLGSDLEGRMIANQLSQVFEPPIAEARPSR